MVAGRCSTSQDSIVVYRGGQHHATPPVTATALRSYSRQTPHNVAYDGVCYTINTRYEFAAVSDYTHPKHCKTCVMVVYDTSI